MKLYGFKGSRSFRIIWMFKELQVNFEYIPISPKDDLFSDWFRAVNPGAKVPVLVDGDLTLTESAAIITYLGDAYPHKKMLPEWGTKERAQYNQWCYFALSELEQPLWLIHKHRFILPKHLRVKEIKESALWEYQQQLEVLALGLGDQKWILGDKFSAADILLGEILDWSINRQIEIQQSNIIEYHNRLKARPAYQLAMEINEISV